MRETQPLTHLFWGLIYQGSSADDEYAVVRG